MKIKIKVTKEVLRQTMYCGNDAKLDIAENCAIAYAVREIMPNAWVSSNTIYPHGQENLLGMIKMPKEAKYFISGFDALQSEDQRHKRLDLPEFSFEIEIPESIIDQINIDDIHKSATLELVN